MAPTETGLTDLPTEIRLMIYEHLLMSILTDREPPFPHPLMTASKRLRYESLPILMRGTELSLCVMHRGQLAAGFNAWSGGIALDRVHFNPLVHDLQTSRPGPPRSWTKFCHTDLADLVSLCGQIRIWTTRMCGIVSVTIRSQKGRANKVLVTDALDFDRCIPPTTITHSNRYWREQFKELSSAWQTRYSAGYPCFGDVRNIADEMERTFLRAMIMRREEQNEKHLRISNRLYGASNPASSSEKILNNLELQWYAADRACGSQESVLHNSRYSYHMGCRETRRKEHI
ncbi:hypothetical protein AUEXF2481DRAFT_35686 [Aureobasidium subglaciale EXF-2481]|uniref:F-box domain-containing protein n=1 Tax=Aureobasidium subglaciale (strain EXF-2481) TaxID=1043005 RepID=A0A074YUB4_AURSE|nr:uncharacterized protein AUEXF2481DRAFT_35686 [Aureobasidium subglaciale EXF-2481]KEQ99754.1 hypothetical protein AUEXF2481DRAFT_35686 [Aureobasidium subglaciale EXF-2481]